MPAMNRSAIRYETVRWQCPHCRRTWARRAVADTHAAQCWRNPSNRTCKTCAHYEPARDACGCEPGCNWGSTGPDPQSCAAGVDLTGRDQPVVGCPVWAASTT